MKTKSSLEWTWSNRKCFWNARSGDRVKIDDLSAVPKALRGCKATIKEHAKHSNGFGYTLLLRVDETQEQVRMVGEFCTLVK